VAGEAEKVTAIMHELVDVHALDQQVAPSSAPTKYIASISRRPPKIAQGNTWRTGMAEGRAFGAKVTDIIVILLLLGDCVSWGLPAQNCTCSRMAPTETGPRRGL
jgi:hypothetical protein